MHDKAKEVSCVGEARESKKLACACIGKLHVRTNKGQSLWLVSIIKYVEMITCQVHMEAMLIK